MKTYKIKQEKRTGFTLAEVLITLGIIGVVAAITIPMLMTNVKAHKLRSQFLKSYSVVQQAFKQMEADDVSLDPKSYYGYDNYTKFYQTYMSYFKGAMDCLRPKEGSSGCYDYFNNYHYKTLDGNSFAEWRYFDDGQFLLLDGTMIGVENPVHIERLWIFVDINGYNTPPDKWGVDLFTFEFKDGELRTMGDIQTKYNDLDKYCSLNSKEELNGIACAHRAKTETDYFKWAVKNVK